ncbi:MAG: DUF2027 domain-containing protein [Bacteroidales bacterium]|nr:DUF2027 domain-containing protein [Bacteroidales bacterium]
MSVKIGDKVRFLNDVGGGIVKSFLNKNTVLVLNEDDFDIPVLIENLVVIEQAQEKPLDKPSNKPSVEDVSYNYSDRDEENYFEHDNSEISKQIKVLLGFEKQDSGVNAYLINDSDYWMLYNILVKTNDESASILAGKLEDNTKLYITNYEIDEIGKISNFALQLIFYRTGKYEPVNPIEKTLEIRPIKFFKDESYIENEYLDKPSIIFPIIDTLSENLSRELSEKELREIVKQKEESDRFQKTLSQKYKARNDEHLREIDLHIHELLEDTSGLGNAEMLEVQISTFKTEMDKAIKERVKKIVFIHGVGNGVLKQELRQTLQKEYKKYAFQDASFKEYGFGATMVVLKRN